MEKGARFLAWAESVRLEIEAELDRLLPPARTAPARLHEAMRHAVFAGGKRVRPLLTVLTSGGGEAVRPTALRGGACLELIHTYSLVHDDLPALDDDDLRRGRPTVHRAYDEATAVLTGDALLTLGLSRLASLPAGAQAVAWVGEAIGTFGMIGGQMEDLEAEKQWPDDPGAALERIHRLKTGALLTVSLRLGGLCARASVPEDDRLRRLGECIGLLFQIGDDILDVEGTSAVLGKTAGKDAASDKLTYPGLFGLEGSRRRQEAVLTEALDLVRPLPDPELWNAFLYFLVGRSS